MNTDSYQDLKRNLHDKGYKSFSYSGKCMYGTYCLGIQVEDEGDIFDLGCILADHRSWLGVARVDKVSSGLIIYFPNCVIDEEHLREGPLNE